MNIPALSMPTLQINTNSNFGMVILDKQIDTAEQQGDSLTKMMELSVNPAIGSNFDASV